MLSPTPISTYPATAGETVWLAMPASLMITEIDIAAWVLMSDNTVAPITGGADGRIRTPVVDQAWGSTIDDVRDNWIDTLTPLPLMPEGTSIPEISVGRFDDDTFVIFPVGLGGDVWGPYRLAAHQIVAGTEHLPDLEHPTEPDHGVGQIIGGTPLDCRITWTEMAYDDDPTPARIMLEPTDA